MTKPKIAVFSGPRSTIANSPTLVTSDKGRLETDSYLQRRFDHLVPQYLHEPVTVRIRKYSAHPLEQDAEEVYHDNGENFFEVLLTPEDGAYLLPYVARRDDGSDTGTPFEESDLRNPDINYGGRQTFFPDASKVFEDIDRGISGRDSKGTVGVLNSIADYKFIRALPPAGYTKNGEQAGVDFFPYSPRPIGKFLTSASLAKATNIVQSAINSGEFDGFIWLEGSPHLEETLYWFSLLIDTALPFVGVSSQRPHGELSNDGDRNIVDAARYIASQPLTGMGAVGIVDEQIFAARSFKKGDARPGGYRSTGGHGGVLGSANNEVKIWYKPVYKTLSTSDLRITAIDSTVSFQEYGDSDNEISLQIKDDDGSLIGNAIASVHLIKYGHYMAEEDSSDPDLEVDIIARINRGIDQEHFTADQSPLFHGFVLEAAAGSGSALPSQMSALAIATFNGFPVVRVGRGDHEGPLPANPLDLTIEGSNLDATKARVLLRAAMLKLGRLPKARDPRNPTSIEREATVKAISKFQELFDTH
ncbi:MAG: hypothetical protein CL777_06475 [Chloroflexi bacterium]|nr:hypothetical protein [Chloroflexota bacterium]|tara:strand:+ start:139 stop:1731 length:1593 start_codon:yes stop_codon:yes gene_type:complete